MQLCARRRLRKLPPSRGGHLLNSIMRERHDVLAKRKGSNELSRLHDRKRHDRGSDEPEWHSILAKVVLGDQWARYCRLGLSSPRRWSSRVRHVGSPVPRSPFHIKLDFYRNAEIYYDFRLPKDGARQHDHRLEKTNNMRLVSS